MKPRASLVDRALDRALAAFGLQRRPARPAARTGMRAFAGARQERLTLDFLSATTSGGNEVRQDLRRLRNRSRTVVRDTAEGKRYAALFPENVIGEHGIELRPQALITPDGELDKRLNATLRDAWDRWSEPAHCTTDGRMGWVDVQQYLAGAEPVDGEFLVRLVRGEGDFGLQLQVLDPDQLDLDYHVEGLQDGRWVRQGVEMNRWGRPIAYHIWDGHPQDQRKGQRRRIPADQIVHKFFPWRMGAVRGVPWLHAALLNVHMIGAHREAELVASRMAASKVFKMTGLEEDPEAPTEIPDEVEPGETVRVPQGAEFDVVDPQHPNVAFGEFQRMCQRSVAMAGGVSYASLTGDLADVNYSSIRAGKLSERDHFRMLQGRFVRLASQPIYRAWLRMAQLTGALEVSAADLERAERVRWRPRGFPWVDPKNDIEAFRAELSLGINSRSREAANRGRDIEEMLEEIDAEQQLAVEYGVDISGAASMRAAGTPAKDDDAGDEDETKPKPEGTKDARRPRQPMRVLHA